MIAADNYAVYIYTENGQLQSNIKIPEGHEFNLFSCNKSRHKTYSS